MTFGRATGTRQEVELPRLTRFHPEYLGLIGIAAYDGDPAPGAAQLFTFDFDIATRFEFLLDHLSWPNQVQRSASTRADAERLSGHSILWQMQFGGAGAVSRKPAQRNNQPNINYFTHS
jgi:hypothetical protein